MSRFEVPRHRKSGASASAKAVLLAACLGLAAVLAVPSPTAMAQSDPARLVAYPHEVPPPKRAEALYDSGHFLKAAAIAKENGSALNLAFAARATMMHAGYIATGDEASTELHDAIALARRAVKADPTQVDGLLQLVIGLGYLSREEGTIHAHENGYGQEARRLIRRAIKLAPNDPWTHAAYGGWNAEIIARGGAFFGGLFYGASRKKAVAAFDKAIALDPRNPVIRVEYAAALIRMDSKHPDLVAARRQLDAALKLPPHDAVQRILEARGKKLLAAIDTDPPDDLMAVLKKITPFEN